MTYDGATAAPVRQRHPGREPAHTGTIATSTNPLQIGGDSIYGQYFAGPIDEVRIYNRALTATQIQTDMNHPVTPTGPDTTAADAARRTLTATAVWASRDRPQPGPRSTDNVGVTGYRVERCQGAGCTTFAQIGPPTGTSFSDTGLSAAHDLQLPRPRHRRRRQPRRLLQHRHRHHPGARHDAADGTRRTLTATAVGGSEINLAWSAATDNVGVTGYRIERCQGTGCSHLRADRAPATSDHASATPGSRAGTSYSYRVRATDAAGNLGPYSNIATATTQAGDRRPRGGVRVRRGRGDDGRRRLGERQQRARRERDLDGGGQVRQGAVVQRHQRAGHDPGRGARCTSPTG